VWLVLRDAVPVESPASPQQPECAMITVSNEPDTIDVDAVVSFLQNESYWARERSREAVEHSIGNSLCYSVLSDGVFVGFARVITDQVTFNYLCDFFILPEFQKQGFGTAALRLIMDDDRLSRGMWILFTQTAHRFYERFGFGQNEEFFSRVMVRRRPGS
jgi:GNAT superfamily N-acetyltransferase